MMPVRAVANGHASKRFAQSPATSDSPHGVRDAIRGDKVIERRDGLRFSNEGVNLRTITVSEENGTCVRAQCADQARPIVLFVAPRLFMLLDDVALVVLDVADGGEPGLDM